MSRFLISHEIHLTPRVNLQEGWQVCRFSLENPSHVSYELCGCPFCLCKAEHTGEIRSAVWDTALVRTESGCVAPWWFYPPNSQNSQINRIAFL